MVLNRAEARYLGELLWHKLQDIGHHTNVCAAIAHGIRSFRALERGKLQGRKALSKSGLFENLRLSSFGIIGRTKHRNHLVATL